MSREIYSGWGLLTNDPYRKTRLADVYLPQVLGCTWPVVLAAGAGGSVLYPSRYSWTQKVGILLKLIFGALFVNIYRGWLACKNTLFINF